MSVVKGQIEESLASAQAARSLKFVFFPLGWVVAHVGRTVEIAKVLRSRGHEVVFAGEDPAHPRSKLDQAQAAGFSVVQVKEPRLYWAWDRFHDYGWPVAVWDSLRLHRWAPLDVILEDIIRVCREQEPDLILGDSSTGVSSAAHILGIPAVGVMNAYNAYFLRPWSPYRFLIRSWDGLLLSRIRGRVYKRHGVRQVNAIELLESIPLISPDLPEFHEPHGTFPNWHAVGPIISEPPVPLPDWYGELADGTPNVYITMGSTGLLEPVLRRTYAALAQMPYRFVVTTGGQVTEETIVMAPGNFRFTTYAPGSKILERCLALIFHGGNGTMYQALAAGVPMIALPSHLEQEVCARILKRHGFGLKLSPRRITGPQLVGAIETVLNDPSYRANARRHRDAVRRADGATKAADLLIAHAREGRPAGVDLP